MSRLGKELVQSAKEALAIARGEMEPAGVYRFAEDNIDVAAIRKRLRLSQDKFAATFGLAASTVRDWEHGRRKPDRIASALLRVIDHAPDTVAEALRKAA